MGNQLLYVLSGWERGKIIVKEGTGEVLTKEKTKAFSRLHNFTTFFTKGLQSHLFCQHLKSW